MHLVRMPVVLSAAGALDRLVTDLKTLNFSDAQIKRPDHVDYAPLRRAEHLILAMRKLSAQPHVS